MVFVKCSDIQSYMQVRHWYWCFVCETKDHTCIVSYCTVSVNRLCNYIFIFTIVWNRGAQILGFRLPWGLNFVRGCLEFVGPQDGTCAVSPSGSWNFEVAPNFLKYAHPCCKVHVVTSVYMCNNFHTCPVICSTSFGLAQRRVYRCK
jgi:hypothetical protein